MSSPDIFLSYNREDAPIARAYADAFAREGLEVWWDATLRSGEAYDEVTEAALRGAKAVVVLWSPRSVLSRWVRAEATIADRNRTLMPVTIEPCERPVMFELTQTADLSHWRGAADDKAWLAFLGDVRRMVGLGGTKPAAAAAAPASSPASSTVGRGKPVVAVLPVTHRVGIGEMEILAEDLTEEITRELAQSPFITVIAARTMAAWRGKPIDHRSLGREIGANYLVESKLHDGGEAIRLTVQLIDAATGSMLWSERFVRKTADVAATPVDFPVAVAAQLGDQFLQIQMVRAMTVPGPFSGWQHMLRAFAYGARAESQGAALEEARKAVAVAPDLGLAHAFLGRVLAGLVAAEGEILDDARKREIQSHIQRAMQLDGDNPTIITFLVAAYAGLGEGETCLRLARRAVELSPNSPTSYHMLGAAYLALGRTGDAIAAFTQQDRFKHFDTMRYIALTYLGMSYLLEGQPEEAEAAIDRALALQPDAFLTLKWKAIVAAHRGEDQAALAAVRRLRELAPTWSIDQHVRQIDHNPHLARKSVAAIATLRRLWNATGTEA